MTGDDRPRAAESMTPAYRIDRRELLFILRSFLRIEETAAGLHRWLQRFYWVRFTLASRAFYEGRLPLLEERVLVWFDGLLDYDEGPFVSELPTEVRAILDDMLVLDDLMTDLRAYDPYDGV